MTITATPPAIKLSPMSAKLLTTVPRFDVACRYGGEEFLIILPETSLEDTFKRAEALREEIKKMEAVFPGQVAGTITMSLGVAAYPEKGLRMEDVLRVADTALYKAKQEGRDRGHFRLTPDENLSSVRVRFPEAKPEVLGCYKPM